MEQHYQAEWNETWDEVFTTLYHDAPRLRESSTANWMALHLRVPWSDDAELRAVLNNPCPRLNPFTQLLSVLTTLETQVRAHVSDFQSLKLSVAYLEAMLWRDEAVAVALCENWNRGRFADSPATSELLFGLHPEDQLLHQWKKAAKYSASLAKEPDHFFLLQSA